MLAGRGAVFQLKGAKLVIAALQDAAAGARPGHCFTVAGRLPPQPCALALDDESAGALAELLPLLGCGEEAAIASFGRLALDSSLEADARAALHAIAIDERRHDALLCGLRDALPMPPSNPALRRASRQFHLAISQGGAQVHLARIAGVDAAVCTVLSRLLGSASTVANDPGVARVLGHIRRDEARHVHTSREIAIAALGRSRARDAAAEARAGLADLLALGAGAFARIGVEPDRLLAQVRDLPNGLFPR